MTGACAATARGGGRSAGFTLIELLVALAVLGLLSSLLYAALRDGARSWQAVEASSDGNEAIARTQTLLRERLGTVPPADRTGTGLPEHPFAGGASRLSFASAWLSHLPAAGLYRFELAAEPDDGGGLALRLGWRPEGAALSGDPARQQRDRVAGSRHLVGGLQRLDIRYFGDPAGGREDAWRADWPATGGRPRLVRIDAAFLDPSLQWPALTVALP